VFGAGAWQALTPVMGDGNLSIAVTGPSGFLYQKSSALTSGYVSPGPTGPSDVEGLLAEC